MDRSADGGMAFTGRELRRELVRSLALPVGPAAAFALAVLLIPARGHVGGPSLLAVFVPLVLAATLVGGRWAGVVSALVTGMAFDSFLHPPYGVLSLDQSSFWISTTSLVGFALVVDMRLRAVDGRRRRTTGDP